MYTASDKQDNPHMIPFVSQSRSSTRTSPSSLTLTPATPALTCRAGPVEAARSASSRWSSGRQVRLLHFSTGLPMATGKPCYTSQANCFVKASDLFSLEINIWWVTFIFLLSIGIQIFIAKTLPMKKYIYIYSRFIHMCIYTVYVYP